MQGPRCFASFTVAALLLVARPPASVGAQGGATLDPAGPSTDLMHPAGSAAASLVYEGLVGFDTVMKITPELASSWRVDRDGRTWMFKIRGGVSFQDGTPLTAQAAAINFEREINSKTNESTLSLWDPIASVTAPRSEERR